MAKLCFPFPARNPNYPANTDIFFVPNQPTDGPDYKKLYERSERPEARLQRIRYLLIEEELETAYRYVSPEEENAKSFSLKFAEIIRAAANAYEILCRGLYEKFYNNADDLNIFNYLALDVHLNLVNNRVQNIMSIGTFPNFPEASQPFFSLANWDKSSVLTHDNIPLWWKAYNEIKHTDTGLKEHATLVNATSIVASLYILIESLYGFGVLSGGFYDLPKTRKDQSSMDKGPNWARVFGR